MTTLLCMVAVVALFVARMADSARNARAVLKLVEPRGGRVHWACSHWTDPDGLGAPAPDCPSFAARIVGHEYIHDVTGIQVSRYGIPAARGALNKQDLSVIYGAHKLRSLSLGGIKIDLDGLEGIGSLQELRELSLYDVGQLTDAHLVSIAKCRKLEGLWFGTDFGTEYWDDKDGKPRLRLSRQLDVTESGIAHLLALKKLRRLSLSGCAISDNEVRLLAQLRQVEELHLVGTNISDSGVKYLTQLPRLRRLDLDSSQVSDTAVRTCGHMTALEELSLDGCLVTDEALNHLRGCKRLQVLSIFNTQINEAAAAEFRVDRPDVTVSGPE